MINKKQTDLMTEITMIKIKILIKYKQIVRLKSLLCFLKIKMSSYVYYDVHKY